MQPPIRFAAAGDILITRRLPASFMGALRQALSPADVRVANLETTITDGTRFASAYSGGTWLTADPGCLSDVRAEDREQEASLPGTDEGGDFDCLYD